MPHMAVRNFFCYEDEVVHKDEDGSSRDGGEKRNEGSYGHANNASDSGKSHCKRHERIDKKVRRQSDKGEKPDVVKEEWQH